MWLWPWTGRDGGGGGPEQAELGEMGLRSVGKERAEHLSTQKNAPGTRKPQLK